MVMTIDVSVGTQSYNVEDEVWVTPGIPYAYDGGRFADGDVRTERLPVYITVEEDGTPTNGMVIMTFEPVTAGTNLVSIMGNYVGLYGTDVWEVSETTCVSYDASEPSCAQIGEIYYGFADYADEGTGEVLCENPGFTLDNNFEMEFKITALLVDASCTVTLATSECTFLLRTLYGGRSDATARVFVSRHETVGLILVGNTTLGYDGSAVTNDITLTLPRRRGGDYPYQVPGEFTVTPYDVWGRIMSLDAGYPFSENEFEWGVWNIGLEVSDYILVGHDTGEVEPVTISFRKEVKLYDAGEDTRWHLGVLGAGAADKDETPTPYGHVSWRANGQTEQSPMIYFDRPANIPLGSSYHKSKSVQRGKHHVKRV